MVEISSVASTLIKSMDEALKICNLSVVYPDGVKKDEPPVLIDGDDKIITFTSAESSIKFVISGNRCNFFCADKKASDASDSDYEKQFESLLEIDSEECELRDIKSLANEASFTTLEYFGKTKGKEKAKKKAKAKKKDKNNPASFDPEGLVYRISNIYPELKPMAEENFDKYEMMLPEEFFNEHANKLIFESLKSGDKSKTKKIFNAFNNFYEDGPKDTQSLIAVSILGLGLKDDKDLLESVEDYMEKDLKSAVLGIIKYLNSVGGKKKMDTLNNPKPFVSKRLKKN